MALLPPPSVTSRIEEYEEYEGGLTPSERVDDGIDMPQFAPGRRR